MCEIVHIFSFRNALLDFMPSPLPKSDFLFWGAKISFKFAARAGCIRGEKVMIVLEGSSLPLLLRFEK